MVIIRILISFFLHFQIFQKTVWDCRKSIRGKNETFTRNDPFQLIFIVLIEKSFWIEKLWIRGDSE